MLETFLILRKTELDIITNVHRSSCICTRYSCQILKKIEFSLEILEKILNYQVS